jgi:mannose-6-phosphate isomerase-like protein (cupin superfamily)
MKFDLKKAKRTFGWDGLKGWVYNEKEDFKNATAAYVETTSKHGKTKNLKSTVVYFVVSGKGVFNLNEKEYIVKAKDVVIIPTGTIYDYKPSKNSKLRLFMVHAPAFDAKFDIHLE